MNCHRCCFDIGLTETRCRICGAKVSRIRASIVAMLSLVVGVGLGSAALTML